jgi:hypothetical protein
MKRFRVPLVGLMAVVAALAINLALVRAYGIYGVEEATVCFLCGVLPMASLLILAAALEVPTLVRGGPLPPFLLGFEVLGWAMALAFITWYSLAPSLLLKLAEYLLLHAWPDFDVHVRKLPKWCESPVAYAAGGIIFLPPQLLIALLGGWLNRKLGFTIRLDRLPNAGSPG